MKRKTMVGVCAVLVVFAVALAVAGCAGLPGARQDGVKSDSSTALLDTQEYNDESDFEVTIIDDGRAVEIAWYVGEKLDVNTYLTEY